MTKILLLWIIAFLIFSCSGNAQQAGKTESLPADSACMLNAQPFIPELNNELQEISGMMTFQDLFWGFNDSGGKNILYAFDRSGEIKKEIELKDADNVDWESVTQDDKFIYIGDFGNNLGNRKNLRVYKFRKKDIRNKKHQSVDSKSIELSYKKQTGFEPHNMTTPFDCEAMVAYNGQLHLFSKNWQDRTTEHYILPQKKGVYPLNVRESFDVKMLVTGADISPDGDTLALLGYENYRSYIWLFYGFKGDAFFSGQNRVIRLQNLDLSQTEGICFYGNDSLLISTEATRIFRQQVFVVDLNELKNGTHQGQ